MGPRIFQIGERAQILAEACGLIARGRNDAAANMIANEYPFTPRQRDGRNYTPLQCMDVFCRDGFIDIYSGDKLIFPGTLRLLANLMPHEFPFHPNWKTDACHFAFYELFPTIDHVVPVTRGGLDRRENWVTTSMMRNMAKANFTHEELGWSKVPPGCMAEWDGLASWFVDYVRGNCRVMSDKYLSKWYRAANKFIK